MIRLLKGTVTAGAVLTGCGVGYEVLTPDDLVEGDEVTLHIHHVISETSSSLYGFGDPATRDVFVALTRVQGVAGKTALALLSQLGVAQIAAAVRDGDTKALSAAKGVGPKLATKLVSMLELPESAAQAAADGADAPAADELTAALVALGYSDTAASDAASHAHRMAGDAVDTSDKLRVALAHLRAA